MGHPLSAVRMLLLFRSSCPRVGVRVFYDAWWISMLPLVTGSKLLIPHVPSI